ncbi:unnamed protein product [Paramecium primaurelia]|uniref:Uncharacterized protein n=1 Tax=Paramecium primaurelia TaxID=5886 RepID=A0A8S1L8D8_PARPR|nr:unnamed protein product [Paramecium primaurelia]
MGSLVSNNKMNSQIEQLEEDNQITVNRPQTFQYYPKLYQKNYDDHINDNKLESNNIDVKHSCFIYFETIQNVDELDNIDDSRETPSWNIPQISNYPDITNNSKTKKLHKKSQTKKKQGKKIIQRINIETHF